MPFSFIYSSSRNNITYHIAVIEYSTTTTEVLYFTAHYQGDVKRKSYTKEGIQVGKHFTVVHNSSTILYQHYVIKSDSGNVLKASIKTLNGRTLDNCMYGGIIIRAGVSKVDSHYGTLGPYCNASVSDPFVDGNNEVALSKGYNGVFLYAYGSHFKINITFELEPANCVSYINICELSFKISTKSFYTMHKGYKESRFYSKTQVFKVRDSYEATQQAMYIDNKFYGHLIRMNLETNIITKNDSCIIIQSISSSQALDIDTTGCIVNLIPQIAGEIRLSTELHFGDGVSDYVKDHCLQQVRIYGKNNNMTITKKLLSIKNTNIAMTSQDVSLDFTKPGSCGSMFGTYRIKIHTLQNNTCQTHVLNDTTRQPELLSFTYLRCGVMLFQQPTRFSFALRLIQPRESELHNFTSKSFQSQFYYITVTPRKSTCLVEKTDCIQMIGVLKVNCSLRSQVCNVYHTWSGMNLQNSNPVSFRLLSNVNYFYIDKRTDISQCPLTISYITVQHSVITYEGQMASRHNQSTCNWQVFKLI